MAKEPINIKGQKFNKLTALEYMGKSRWKFYCDCGKTTMKPGYDVTHGRTKSCGCLAKETAHKLNLKKWGEASLTNIYCSYRKTAENRKLSFNLSFEELKNIIDQPCHYCGAIKTNEKKSNFNNGSYYYNGIDRVNNNIGYELSNVVPSCFMCNEAKKTKSYNEFLDWVNRIYEYRIKK